MATVLQIRRGTAADAAAFLGEEGELYLDMEHKTLYAHDGTTVGGFSLGGITIAGNITAADAILSKVAEGDIYTGNPIVLNDSTTVSRVHSTGTPQSILSGTTQLPLATTDSQVIDFDPFNDNRFAVVYRAISDTNSGKVIIGQIDATGGIKLGAAYKFSTTATYTQSHCVRQNPVVQNQLLIGYSEYTTVAASGHLLVGTVNNDTTVTFGTHTIFSTGSIASISFEFDPFIANKFILLYYDGLLTATDRTRVVIGTIVDTTISVNIADSVPACSGTISSAGITIAMDPSTANKFIITFIGSTNVIGATLGTISGNSLTITSLVLPSTHVGSVVRFQFLKAIPNKVIYYYYETATLLTKLMAGEINYNNQTVTFGPATTVGGGLPVTIKTNNVDTDGQFVFFHKDSTSLVYNVGRLDGTNAPILKAPILIGSAAVMTTPAVNALGFANNDYKFLYAWSFGSPYYVTLHLGWAGNLITNLTTTNFIGFATTAYTSGQNASIYSFGETAACFSGLTPGAVYYVQYNGSISKTVDPIIGTVWAGTAKLVNSLLVGG